tara:strand:+ start:251 stop:376 length:126 start_codon:yes stop_codon:yes gene_type:complete
MPVADQVAVVQADTAAHPAAKVVFGHKLQAGTETKERIILG